MCVIYLLRGPGSHHQVVMTKWKSIHFWPRSWFLNTVPLVEVSRAPGKMVDCGSRAGKVQDEPRTFCSAKK